MSFLTAATASTSKVTGISLVQAVARNGSAGVTARLYSSSGRHEKESSEETTAGKAYVIVRGMPKTMLPSDVHSRLKSIGAFKRGDIAVSNVIRLPDYVAQNTGIPAYDAPFHITLPDKPSARQCREAIASNSFFLSDYKEPRREFQPEKKRRGLGCQEVNLKAEDWLYERWQEVYLKKKSAPKQRLKAAEQTQAEAAAQASATEAGLEAMSESAVNVMAQNPLVDDNAKGMANYKLAPVEPQLRGRQVMLDGLPWFVTESSLRKYFKAFQFPEENVIQVLPHRNVMSSRIITFSNSAEAHRFVRRYHLVTFFVDRTSRFVQMKAQVIV